MTVALKFLFFSWTIFIDKRLRDSVITLLLKCCVVLDREFRERKKRKNDYEMAYLVQKRKKYIKIFGRVCNFSPKN